jgi:peptidoglycan/LPS O-acetylase OafA/YrhL
LLTSTAVRRENWLIYCVLAAVAIGFAAWEILERRRGRRWPVRLLAVAGALFLTTGLWGYAMRGATVADRASVPTIAWLLAILAAVPYVLLRSDDEIRGDP